GLAENSTARAAIGYKEIVASLAGECSLDEAVDAIKQATRRFAKRQISWFKRDDRIVHLDGLAPEEERLAEVESIWLS
ncbi:MAG: tRNA (adenosine(37)-N6)-dimethylallyltransferase MiaA, partial [Eggerthellaceae bacterium]|nr:tRNA (adenosine(37)-N6)-dimethylallyltransferase MiaA [Eggerthellaceae bacterium]